MRCGHDFGTSELATTSDSDDNTSGALQEPDGRVPAAVTP